ncbi:hypothetical protein JD969_08370 [Planctomycetota bacterium]|nr:hypothetical protein JD969_08370 [Planctomycetota bacterium]
MRQDTVSRIKRYSTSALVGFAIAGTGYADSFSWQGADSDTAKFTNWLNHSTNSPGLPYTLVDYKVFGNSIYIDTTIYFNGAILNNYANPEHDGDLLLLNDSLFTLNDRLTVFDFTENQSVFMVENGSRGTISNKARMTFSGGFGVFSVGRGDAGETGLATFDILSGGEVETDQVHIGQSRNGILGNGKMTVDGVGSLLYADFDIRVGTQGFIDNTIGSYGELHVSNSGYVETEDMTIGNLGTGEVLVDGGTLTVHDELYVGANANAMPLAQSTGTLTVQGGGGLVDAETLYVGYGGIGDFNVHDSATVSLGNLYVGLYDGEGSMLVDEGVVDLNTGNDNVSSLFRIGVQSKFANVTVDGGDSYIEMYDSDGVEILIGDQAAGSLVIRNGGTYQSKVTKSSNYIVGGFNLGTGTLTVHGTDIHGKRSTFRDDFGYVRVGHGSPNAFGTVNVTGGALMDVERMDIGNAGTGNLFVLDPNSRLETQTLKIVGTGSMAMISSGGIVDTEFLTIDSEDDGVGGLMTVATGGTLEADNVKIGVLSSGRLNIAGGNVNADSIEVGSQSHAGDYADAVIDLTSNGSLSTTGSATIGKANGYNAVLNIHGGSSVDIGHNLLIGSANTGHASVDVMGLWNDVSELRVTQHLAVGSSGDGNAVFRMNDYSSAEIGRNMYVGNIQGGDHLAVIDGINAQVTVDNTLHVGFQAEGKMEINQGQVSAGLMMVGSNFYGHGHLVINSSLANLDVTSIAYIGDPIDDESTNTSGRVDLINYGELDVNQKVVVGKHGELNIWGGILKTREIEIDEQANVNWSAGMVFLTNDTVFYQTSGLDRLLGDSDTLHAGQVLVVDGILNLSKQLGLNGGTLIVNDIDGFAGSRLLDFQSGTLGFLYGGDVGYGNNVLGDRLIMKEDMTIASGGTFTNGGWISGSGTFTTNFPSHEDIYAYDFGSFANTSDGTLHLDSGDRMFIDMDDVSNDGVIEVFDGQLIVNGDFYNRGDLLQFDGLINIDGQLINENQITGLDIHLRASNIVNQGDMDFADTQHLIFGNLKNELDGKITVTRGARLTLHDHVQNDTTIEISDDASVVIFGTLSGSGSITGGGTTYIEGTLTPGNSPGMISVVGDIVLTDDATAVMELAGDDIGTEYDALQIDGELTIDGTLEVALLDGFNPLMGQLFQIFEASNIEGQFDELLLPTLTGNLDWDTSQLSIDGSLRVIPEPATLLLLSLLSLPTLRRRRSA